MLVLLGLGCGGVIELVDAHNHSVYRDLHLPVLTVDSTADLLLDLTGVQTDFRCRPLGTTELVLSVIRFPEMTPLAIEVALEQGTLKQSDQSGMVELEVDGTEPVRLSALRFYGADTGMETLGRESTFAVTLHKREPYQFVSVALLEAIEGKGDTRVPLADGCGQLEVDAAIADPVVRYRRPEAVSWSALTLDATGSLYNYNRLESVAFAYFEGMRPAEMAENYLWLDTLITEQWSVPIDTGSVAVRQDELAALDGMVPDSDQGAWVIALGSDSFGVPRFLTTITD